MESLGNGLQLPFIFKQIPWPPSALCSLLKGSERRCSVCSAQCSEVGPAGRALLSPVLRGGQDDAQGGCTPDGTRITTGL